MHSKNQSDPTALSHYEALVSHILDGLIGDAERTIDLSIYSGKLHIDIEVADEQRGNIIGKGGSIAHAIRALVEAAPLEHQTPVLVNIID